MRWVLMYRETPGNPQRKSTFALQRDALEFQRDNENAKGNHPRRDPDAGKESLGEFIDRWLAGELPVKPLRPMTHDNYSRWARDYVKPTLGERPLKNIQRRDITDLIANLPAGS